MVAFFGIGAIVFGLDNPVQLALGIAFLSMMWVVASFLLMLSLLKILEKKRIVGKNELANLEL